MTKKTIFNREYVDIINNEDKFEKNTPLDFIKSSKHVEIDKGLMLIYSPKLLHYKKAEPAIIVPSDNDNMKYIIVGEIYANSNDDAKEFILSHEILCNANGVFAKSKRDIASDFEADIKIAENMGIDETIAVCSDINNELKKFKSENDIEDLANGYSDLRLATRIKLLKYAKSNNCSSSNDFYNRISKEICDSVQD